MPTPSQTPPSLPSPPATTDATSSAALSFSLDATPVSAAERTALAPALRAAGLDARYLEAMNGLVQTRSANVIPKVLRVQRGERLVALAYILECRRTASSLFPRLGRVLDVAPMPIFYWLRADPAVDLTGSADLIDAREDASALHAAMLRYLCSRYVMGCVVDRHGAADGAPCVRLPFVDHGVSVLAQDGGADALLAQRKNLKRKLAKFKNKGGAIDIVHGAPPDEVRAAMLACLRSTITHAVVTTPFQENYLNLVEWASRASSDAFVHVVARLDGHVVGYHTFLETGGRLVCLSGGFDRARHTTYHAYENVLLEAMRYAQQRGLERVSFGPVLNPTKSSMMPSFERAEIRFFSRHRVVRGVLARVLPRSAVGSATVRTYVGLGERPASGELEEKAPESQAVRVAA